MSIPLQSGRVTQQMQSSAMLNSIMTTQAQLLKVGNQISTGNRLSIASDDPTAATAIMQLNTKISTNTQYSSNLDFATSMLSTADSTLTSVSTLITQAQTIASTYANTTNTAADRQSEADVVNSLIDQLMSYANTQYNGQSVFAGQAVAGAAYTSTGGGYQYSGTTTGQSFLTPSGSSIAYTLDGSSVFGGSDASVGGSSLSPSITGSTKLSDLAGTTGDGVSKGSMNVTVGGTSVSVDLSNAATVNDVVNLVNAGLSNAGSTATISTSGSSFVVNGDATQSVTFADASGSTTATDLGLTGTTAAGATSTGGSVGAKVTATTLLSSLNGGAGLDSQGFTITNGSNSATISMAGLTSVGDLVNKINASGTNVTASITADGSGIQVTNTLAGSDMTIGENGGLTATQLGIRSMNTSTKLSSLNNGTGVTTASSTAATMKGTIQVTGTNGTSFSVNVAGITSVSGMISAINSATGNTTVTAAMNSTGNGITLTDSSSGTGNLAVAANSDFVANGTTLGLFGTGTGGTLTGTNVTFSTDDMQVTRKDGTSFTVNLSGAKTIQDVLSAINNADGNTGSNKVTAGLNSTGNGIQLSDASTGSGTLSVTALNASTAAASLGIAKTASASSSGTINGDDVNPVEPQSLFTSLVKLRNALLNNDTAGITSAGTMLTADATRATTANGLVGAKEQDISNRQTALTTEQTALNTSLTNLANTDPTKAISQYEALNTAYQAALQVANTTQNLSLLDFLS